jgi:signal transduction histidine kinase
LDHSWKLDSPLQQWLDSKEPEFFIEPLINIRQLDKIETDLPHVTAELPSPWVILIPIGGEALWFLDQKKSGSRFWKEDLELAIQMASSASLEWEKFRLILQKQREAERIQTAKMESLRRLVAGTAHELNNPIGVIASSTDVSLKAIDRITDVLDKDLPKEHILKTTDLLTIFELLEDANRSCKMAADKVANIVVNLRRFVRLDEGEWQVADIHEGLDSVIALIQPEMENRIDIQKDYGQIPQIYCSPSGLNQVFMYLLKNASEAIEDQGEILVKTSTAEDTLKIQIRDTGVGIPHANLNKIFDPGFTTKGVKVGVGLGLSISYHIIREHNGSIDVTSQLGKGSTFTISLPVQV